MNHVYVIQSKEGYQYIGSTTDLEKRLFQHRNHLAGWTKRGTDWELIYLEEFETYSEARKREKWLKTGVGRDYLKSKLAEGS
ncbi:MAG: GIY-YIG nuclease family protein [Ignavibacteriaceae bacterium]|nr:GIY-YIG nuclease family protein [Ignavibacteriaceae bacterium]